MLRTAAIALRRLAKTAASRPSVLVRSISSGPVFSPVSDLWTEPAVRPVLSNLDLPRRYARDCGRESYASEDDDVEFDEDDEEVEDEGGEFLDDELGDSEGNFSGATADDSD